MKAKMCRVLKSHNVTFKEGNHQTWPSLSLLTYKSGKVIVRLQWGWAQMKCLKQSHSVSHRHL